MTTPARPPSMHDVATLAGVSYQTVSRVLNSPELVRPATRVRVEGAIEQLGYHRNLAARALKTSRSGTIGVVTTGSDLYGPMSALTSIERVARERGLSTLVSVLERDDTDGRAVFRTLVEREVEGIVVIAPEVGLTGTISAAAESIPTVAVASGLDGAGHVSVVAVDQEEGGRLAARHLLGLGHRRLAHLTGPMTWFDAAARTAGWRAELDAAGIRAAGSGVVGTAVGIAVAAGGAQSTELEGDWSAASGYELGRQLFAGSPRPDQGGTQAGRGGSQAGDTAAMPTAVFAANDLMALGLMTALREAGLAVPGDVSVVGFDNMPGSNYFAPPLTTVRQPFEQLGEAALAALFSDTVTTTRVAPELIMRASTCQA